MRSLQTEPLSETQDIVSKNIQMDAELASWLDREASVMGITPSLLVTSLLEWARAEHITSDEDVMVFPS